MRFIVKGQASDGLPVAADVALSAYEATFEIFRRKKDPRIVEVYPHADERATTLVVEVPTAEELSDCLSHLPGFWFSTWESHPIQSVENVLTVIRGTLAQRQK